MKLRKLFALSLIILFTGCSSYSTLQSATTLPPGKFHIAPGISTVITSETREFSPEVGARYGLFRGVDIGAKMVGLNVYSGYSTFFGDGKIQLMRSKVDIALDFGYSYSSFDEKTLDIQVTNNSFYPMLLVGQRQWYSGVKGVYSIIDGQFKTPSNKYITGSDWTSANFVLGGIFGERKSRILPEINMIISRNGDIWFVPAVGIQIGIN
jgi:hypothetical protein